MLDKILIGVWVLLSSILIIENIVTSSSWYLFLDKNAGTWLIIFVSIIIWMAMWYGVKWIMSKNKNIEEDDSYNF